jgi:xyloglucan fucosyltransferase
MVMGRPGNIHGDEERQPLRGGLETERAPAPSFLLHGVAKQQEARRGGRLWRACVRARLVLCLLTVPAVLFLLQWQAASSPQWVFDFEPPAEDHEQGMHLFPFPVHTFFLLLCFGKEPSISVFLFFKKNCHSF